MTKKGKKTPAPAMGHDPLAWIAQDDSGPENNAMTEDATVEDVVIEEKQDIAVKAEDNSQVEESAPEVEAVTKAAEEDDKPKEEAVEVIADAPKNEAEVIMLDGDMTIVNIEAIHRTMVEKRHGCAAIVIDGHELQRIDTSGVQMLRAFVRDAEKTNVSLAWKNVPDTLIENATLLGLHDQMLFSNNVDL